MYYKYINRIQTPFEAARAIFLLIGDIMATTVKKDSKTEFTEKKSVFIGQAFFVTSEDEAKAKIAEVRAQYPDATHVCYAYSLRSPSVQRFSDDGEPSGTAGMPILHVLQTKGLVDTLITVTRYFGGILLGAGGLVRAYSSSAADAITAAGVGEIVEYTRFEMKYGYDLHSSVERALTQAGADIEDRDFGADVTIKAALQTQEYEAFKEKMKNEFYTVKVTETEKFSDTEK